MNALADSIAGTVILFNPSDSVFENISTYVDQVGRLYVIDNSIHCNHALIQRLKGTDNITYINNNGNKGVAYALNVGARMAQGDGFSFLLTMDQDTKLWNGYIMALIKPFSNQLLDNIGIIAPRYTKNFETENIQDVLFVMTSGNLLNLHAYDQIGPFMDQLFIDHVDHEYCLRLNRQGFRVVQVNKVGIVHRPGTSIAIFSESLSFSSHSPLRLYYFCRNGFYVSNKYKNDFPAFRRIFLTQLMKEALKIPFEDSAIRRLRMIWKGYIDYKNKKWGELETL